jgi:putative transcriptional regulator
MAQIGQIVRVKRSPSREFHVNSEMVKKLPPASGLSQPRFAALLPVDVGTLRNWEQGLREPSGPAKALPTEIKNDPKNP